MTLLESTQPAWLVVYAETGYFAGICTMKSLTKGILRMKFPVMLRDFIHKYLA